MRFMKLWQLLKRNEKLQLLLLTGLLFPPLSLNLLVVTTSHVRQMIIATIVLASPWPLILGFIWMHFRALRPSAPLRPISSSALSPRRSTSSKTRGPVVFRPPGSILLCIVSWLPISNKSIERVFRPLVAELQDEYIRAYAAGHHWESRFIRLRYYIAFLLTLGAFVASASLKRVVEIWKIIP